MSSILFLTRTSTLAVALFLAGRFHLLGMLQLVDFSGKECDSDCVCHEAERLEAARRAAATNKKPDPAEKPRKGN